LVTLAKARLRASPYRSIQQLACDFEKGALVLHGRLPTFFQNQVAQQAVATTPGVERIDNRVEVG
jgi:hypothetical protein